MRHVGRGTCEGKTRATLRHVPNNAWERFAGRRKRYKGSATHGASLGFPLVLPSQKHFGPPQATNEAGLPNSH